MEKIIILVLVNNAVLSEELVKALFMQGYEALAASSGKEGLKLLIEEQPSVALIDLALPDVDGIEALRIFKKALPEIKVIMIADDETVDAAVRAIRKGAFDIEKKPLIASRLSDSIKRALESSGS